MLLNSCSADPTVAVSLATDLSSSDLLQLPAATDLALGLYLHRKRTLKALL